MRPGRKKTETGGDYAAWAQYLAGWGDGGEPDGSALGPLDPAKFASDTWRRITDRFTDALARRLEGWHKAFARAAAHAAGDEFEYGRALQQGRDGLIPVLALAGDPRLPEELRDGLTSVVENKIADMQRQLERDIERQPGPRRLRPHGRDTAAHPARQPAHRGRHRRACRGRRSPHRPGRRTADQTRHRTLTHIRR